MPFSLLVGWTFLTPIYPFLLSKNYSLLFASLLLSFFFSAFLLFCIFFVADWVSGYSRSRHRVIQSQSCKVVKTRKTKPKTENPKLETHKLDLRTFTRNSVCYKHRRNNIWAPLSIKFQVVLHFQNKSMSFATLRNVCSFIFLN